MSRDVRVWLGNGPVAPTAHARAPRDVIDLSDVATPELDVASDITHGSQVDASNTGPTGALTASGGLDINTPGATVEDLDITGQVHITADNVTLRNCRITYQGPYPLYVDGAADVLIEDVEVDGTDGNSICVYLSGSPGATLRRCNIHGGNDDVRMQDNNQTIEFCYIWGLFRVPLGHHDILQMRRGDNCIIRGNNLQAYNPVGNNGEPDAMNACYQGGSLLTGTTGFDNLLMEYNLFNGGINAALNGGVGSTGDVLIQYNQFGPNCGDTSALSTGTINWGLGNTWQVSGDPAYK